MSLTGHGPERQQAVCAQGERTESDCQKDSLSGLVASSRHQALALWQYRGTAGTEKLEGGSKTRRPCTTQEQHEQQIHDTITKATSS